MLQGGQVQGQVQTTQAQWRQQQLEMHKQKQQQIIHQHVQTLTIEQRQQFAAMSAMEKQQYLAQRNLLLPNPSANWGQQVQLQRHTIQVSYFSTSYKKILYTQEIHTISKDCCKMLFMITKKILLCFLNDL